MLEINVTVNCPDLLAASQVLATALAGAVKKSAEIPTAVTPAVPTVTPVVPTVTPVAPTIAPIAPTGQNPAGSAVGASPASTIPSEPTVTLEQIANAGAELINRDASKKPELLALLQRFGTPAVINLKPDQFADFAAGLRGLGANI